MKLGMLIDLNTCAGCHACAIACKVENAVPQGIYWNKVIASEEGKYPNAVKKAMPRACMHCSDAPCVEVCPTGASAYDENKTVQIDLDKCIGCQSCMDACPYGARSFTEAKPEYFKGFSQTPYEKTRMDEHPLEKVEKCTFCKSRVAEGKEPSCVKTCITKSRVFGDLDDPKSEISKKIKEMNAKQYQPENGTKPSIYYAGKFPSAK